ncbi:PAS fold protein [Pirellula sp. SH-Sr6A]|uniref:PAS domain-containing protein n=1 Tax=Pirellula sp. SH-Sr6A TaxID=1632865 RepID=UPI00078D48D1|nr:PAS domain-containing protein [Pirellula sp. SH-Sr6A]AMV34271.1 PAS fold protein [Pirellula sp. SH-Sr6A]
MPQESGNINRPMRSEGPALPGTPWLLKANLVEAMIDKAREAILILDETFQVQMANPSFLRLVRLTLPDIRGRVIFELGSLQWDIPSLHHLLEERLSQQPEVDDWEVKLPIPHCGVRTFLLNARWIQPEAGPKLLFLYLDGLENQRPIDEQDSEYAERFQSVFKHTPIGISILDQFGRIKRCNPSFLALLGQSEEGCFTAI